MLTSCYIMAFCLLCLVVYLFTVIYLHKPAFNIYLNYIKKTHQNCWINLLKIKQMKLTIYT